MSSRNESFFYICLDRLRQNGIKTNAEIENFLGLSNGYISKIKENPGKLLLALNKKGISTDWFLTGKGDMFLENQEKGLKQEEKHPLVANFEAMIDKLLEKHPLIEGLEVLIDRRLEKLEAEIAELKSQIKKAEMDSRDTGMYASEPEPEYSKVLSVHDIAAGPPITQSDDLSSYRDIPRRLIKTRPEDYYAAHIKGESMTEAGIPDERWVLIRISDAPRHNAIQVVRRGDKSTLKRMWEGEDHRWTLLYDDNSGRRIEIDPDEDYQVQGDFVAVLPED